MSAPVIVSTEWLNEQLQQKKTDKLRILDVTWYGDGKGETQYLQKHIPGAVYYDLFEGVELTSVYIRKLADAATFGVNARKAGVDKDTHVVLCDGCEGKNGYIFGPRVWLMFQIYGHENVSVLDGGLEKWISDGYETTDVCPKIPKGNFESEDTGKWQKSYEEMIVKLTAKDVQVFDARPKTMFDGKAGEPLSGHFPGAVNLPHVLLLDPAKGCLKDVEGLKQVFKNAGADLKKPLTTMCIAGVFSCLVAMSAHMCGCPDAAVYLGGFMEWKNRAGASKLVQT